MIRLLWSTAIALLFIVAPANAGERGAIKRFVDTYPIPTYKLNGQGNGDFFLEAANTPPTSEIWVDGWWPENKMLLISFSENSRKAYFILFSAVEMQDQKLYAQRLAVGGGLARLIHAND